MSETRSANEQEGLLRILGSWLLAALITTAGVAGAWFIAYWVQLFGPTYEEIQLLWILVGPLLSWPVIGLVQLAIFGSRIKRKLPWVLLTGLAWVITFAILLWIMPSLFPSGSRSLVLHPVLLACISGILIGSIFGLLQWSMLRRTVASAGWWILSWVAAWMLGLVLLQHLSRLPLSMDSHQLLRFLFLVSSVTIGMVTGVGYVWIIHPSAHRLPVMAGLAAIPLAFAMGLAIPLTTSYSQQSRTMRSTYGLSNVLDLSFSQDGSMLAGVTNVASAQSEDRGVAIWDIESGKEIASLKTSADHLSFLPDGKQIVTAGPLHNPVAVWDIASGEQVYTIPEQANDIAVSQDGKLLAIATGDHQGGVLVLWDLSTGKEFKRLRGTMAVYSVEFSPDGKFVAMVLGELGQNQMRVVEIEHPIARLVVQGLSHVSNPVFTPDGARVLLGTGKTIQAWSIESEKRVALLSVGGNAGTLALSPDGKVVAVARGQLERDKSIYIYDAVTGELLDTLMGHTQPVTSLAFSPDGSYLASASWDGTVRLWRMTSDD